MSGSYVGQPQEMYLGLLWCNLTQFSGALRVCFYRYCYCQAGTGGQLKDHGRLEWEVWGGEAYCQTQICYASQELLQALHLNPLL